MKVGFGPNGRLHTAMAEKTLWSMEQLCFIILF